MKRIIKYMLLAIAVLTLFLGAFGYHVYRNIGALPDETRFARLPYYRNGQFHNLYDELVFYPEKATGKGGWLRNNDYVPKQALPMVGLAKADFSAPEPFAYYWLGHSSAIMELNRQRIIIDPVFDNAAPINLSFIVPRIQAAPIKREQLPAVDVVLITHDHYDHLEAKTMRYLADKAPHFIVPLGVGARLQSWGVPADKITELGWGDSVQLNGIVYTAETALHYSRRANSDRDKTLWVSYVLEGADQRIYWGADSGYGKHFREIGRKYAGFDLAFMEIDAANPGWPNTHMFPEQAVQATIDVGAKRMLPIHWGVFSLGRNPWDESIKRAWITAQQKGVVMDVPKMGEKYTPETHRQENWWEKVQ